MRCPFCDHPDTKVIDARNQRDAAVKRRRRECSECQRRFTTYERIEDLLPMVVKSDGRRELFDRLKIITGMQKACQKRPVSVDAIEQAVLAHRALRARLRTNARCRASASATRCSAELRALDPVAWLRFMSVYLNFRTIEDFRKAMGELAPEDGD